MFSVFSILSQLTPRSLIRDGRMEQLVGPCPEKAWKGFKKVQKGQLDHDAQKCRKVK